MAILQGVTDAIRGSLKAAPDPTKQPIPPDVQQRLTRGQNRMRQGAAMRNLCLRFFRNQHYWYVNEQGALQVQPTVTYINGGGKPRHRVRTTRNLITPIVKAKVSASTQRVPSYEINPSSFDAQRVSAASLAEKVALFGYDEWRVRRATKKAATLALVADEGFAWPFWDSTVGPFIPDEQGAYVGLGDVRIRVLSRNEVGWEPGLDFEDSPWYIVVQARPIDEVMGADGYLGGPLVPDANTASEGVSDKRKQQAEKLVLVIDYLERPCIRYPQGRWLTIANKRVIGGLSLAADPETGEPEIQTRPYPLTDEQDRPLDEPVLHRLSYTVDPDSDEDMGLVRFLIDPQRSYNDLWNKALEWKNRVLNPRIMAPVNSMVTRPDDTPGGIDYYKPIGGLEPKWETPIPVPESLFELMRATLQDIQQIAASNDLPPEISSGKGIEAQLEQLESQWADFIGDLAEWHSRLMRHCLYLVCRHYSEPRLLKIRGRVGWESIEDFQGADLLGEVDVRVLPGSLQSLTRDDILARLQFLTAAFPGAISPEQAMAALQGGTAEQLIASYELDVSRANRIVQRIRSGPENFLMEPVDPGLMGGDPNAKIPSWLPRPQDNLSVHRQVVGDYTKTDSYDGDPEPVQEAFTIYLNALDHLEQIRAAQQAMQQQQLAEQMGMANAAAPQQGKPMPSQPNVQSPGQPPSAQH